MPTANVYAPVSYSIEQLNPSSHLTCYDSGSYSANKPVDIDATYQTNILLYVSASTVKSIKVTVYGSGTSYECCDGYDSADLNRAVLVKLFQCKGQVGQIGWVLFGHVVTAGNMTIASGDISQNYLGVVGRPARYPADCYTGQHVHMECSGSGVLHPSRYAGEPLTAGSQPIYYWNFSTLTCLV